MKRILIADDHAIVRQGWKHILSEELPEATCGEAGTVQEVREKLRKGKWDIVVLDINMPGRSGLDELKELRRLYPTLPILILSMYTEHQYAVRALKAGAAGYLTKGSAPEELATAIKRALAGGKYVSPSVAEHLAQYLDEETDKPPHLTLSDREYHVLCLIASGKSVAEIADQLAVGKSTVGTYRARILEKLRLKNNTELTHYALEHRLVERLVP